MTTSPSSDTPVQTAEDVARELPSPNEQRQPFEDHPELAKHLEYLANTVRNVSLRSWQEFIGALNTALITRERQRPQPQQMVTRGQIWKRVDELIESSPVDGINAEGVHSSAVAEYQSGVLDGLRQARLSICALFPTQPAPTAEDAEDGPLTAAHLQALLNERDTFIVNKGLWMEFMDTLPRTARKLTAQPVVPVSVEEIARLHCKTCHHPGTSQCRGPNCWCWVNQLLGANAIHALLTRKLQAPAEMEKK